MPNYLVVADQTLGGDRLLEEVRSRVQGESARIHVVVPATGADEEAGSTAGVVGGGTSSNVPMSDPAGTAPGSTTQDDGARQAAFNRMKAATARFEELGASAVDGQVGDPDPLEAIAQAIDTSGPFDEIIVATPPRSVSKWVSMDVASRAERRFDVPVTHVEEDATTGDLE